MKLWTSVIFFGSIVGCTLVVGLDDRSLQGVDGGDAGDAAVDNNAVDVALVDQAAIDAPTSQCTVPASSDGGCCGQSLTACIGQACAHCNDCEQQNCKPNEFCCIKGDPKKPYMGVGCEMDLNHCP